MQTLHEKIKELNTRLLDVAEWTNVHILVNITLVEWDIYSRTTGISDWFPPDKLMYAALGQTENVFTLITK